LTNAELLQGVVSTTLSPLKSIMPIFTWIPFHVATETFQTGSDTGPPVCRPIVVPPCDTREKCPCFAILPSTDTGVLSTSGIGPPPTGTGLCSTSGVVLAPADARRLAIGYIITSSADTGPPVCRLIVGPSTDTRRVALRCITRSPTDTRPWTTDGVAKPHYQTPYTGKSMLRAHDEVVGACTLMRTKILLVIADNEVPKPRRRISFIGVARATANMDIDPFENNVRPTHTIYIAINETDVGKNRL